MAALRQDNDFYRFQIWKPWKKLSVKCRALKAPSLEYSKPPNRWLFSQAEVQIETTYEFDEVWKVIFSCTILAHFNVIMINSLLLLLLSLLLLNFLCLSFECLVTFSERKSGLCDYLSIDITTCNQLSILFSFVLTTLDNSLQLQSISRKLQRQKE